MDKHKIRDIKLVPIGNSKGIRIPKALLQKYGFNSPLLLEETENGCVPSASLRELIAPA